jgi:hypothetical protein
MTKSKIRLEELHFMNIHKESKILIDWFHFNCMQDNPDKFQAIAVGEKNNPLYLILNMQIFHSGLRTVAS